MLVQVNQNISLDAQYSTVNGDKLSLDKLLKAWTYGKAVGTVKNYLAIARKFLGWINKDLTCIGLVDLQDYLASLDCSSSTKKTKMATIKSLLTFCQKLGVTHYNPGVLLKTENAPDQLHSRILTEVDIQLMVRLEPVLRNRLILKTLYLLGLRVSELTSIWWLDFTETSHGVVLRVVGKGKKERFILVPSELWKELQSLRTSGGAVFKSRHGDSITPQAVWEVVKKAAARVDKNLASPHWLRHAHASHALDRGAKIHQVRETLGHSSLTTTSRYVKSKIENSSSLVLAI
jgi:integrase/recombinase XerD